MMAGYASNTTVSVARSKAEIEETLQRFGIEDSGVFNEGHQSFVIFKHRGRPYSIVITLPNKDYEGFRVTPGGKPQRTEDQAYTAWEQACRVKWRELALLIKAKVVAITSGAASFENEFLAYAMLPNRITVGEWAECQLAQMAAKGEMPELLPRPQKALKT